MARLMRGRIEWEGMVREQLSMVEGETPPPWSADAVLKQVGNSYAPLDAEERVSGRAVYTCDVQLPGMLHARVLRSPYPHARIKRIDVSRAAAHPGVRGVIHHGNVPPIDWMSGTKLLEPVVRFAGDEVAAVAADDEAAAEDALALVKVEYDVLPFVLDGLKALEPGAPRIYSGGNLIDGKPRTFQRGDVEQGFREADVVLEKTFNTQSALHNCMETHGTVARWDGDDLTVWESTQSINRVRDDLAAAFGLPLNRIRVISQYMGGGFGSKQYSGKWTMLAALLARQTRRPVQLMMTREEENLATGNRAPTVQRLKVGAMKDGTLMAMDLKATVTIGAYGRAALFVEGPVQVLYMCKNVRTVVSSVYTNSGPARSFRGPGYVEGAFPLESMIDEVASRLGMDPVDMRMKNYAAREMRSGKPFSGKHLDECYRKGAEMIGWASKRGRASADGHIRRGVGMASQTWGGGGGPPAYAWVKVNSDGTAEVLTGSQDIGTSTKTVLAQIAAEELGLPIEDIVVHMGDTSLGPYDPVSWGSMTVSSVGPAVREAAIDAATQLRQVSADFLKVAVETVDIREGRVYIRAESRPRMTTKDIAGQIGEFTIIGRGAREQNRDSVDVRTFGAQFAEVEVDVRTGTVTVRRVVSVHDCGRVINPMGGANQVEGAVVQGIGFAVSEQRVIDQASGIVLTTNFEGYKEPTAMDTPEIGHAFVNDPDNVANCIGAKGLGEPALIPTGPAVANAVASATGIRILSLPITREKILEALQKSASRGKGRGE